MRVGVLGELEVRDGGGEVVVAGAKQRALLAMLALHAGRVVPTEHLVDALWGDDPPAGVRNGLQGLASKLRRTLGSADLVAMRGDGYALDVSADAVDAHRYEQLVAQGRGLVVDGDLVAAVDVLTEADGLWRGEALADFAYDDFAVGVITRLSELRLTVIEERLDLEMQLGRHLAAVAQLEELVARHPLRERLRGILMLALYRAGRQADALRAFQDGRLVLGEELGLEPGHALRQLEAAILAQDRSLDPPVDIARAAPRRSEARWTIPESLTDLIGRDHELKELSQLVSEHRLVTLVGPGGVGKTRLALEVARAEAGTLALGGCLVELAPLGDPAGVRAAIAAALDVPDPAQLAEMIGDRELLIVLDNCEHLIATAAEVAEDLLQRCPHLRLLTTSREGLRVGGETIWSVPPLAADDAVGLFLARARASGAELTPGDDDITVIRDVCARLDGLPLAIELAAARTKAIPTTQIAARLHDRFRLLTGGSRTALPRQQTLRAVVDWSYELLFDDEQRLFEALSVFPGGCDLATAEVVFSDDEIAADDLADHLQALVDKSLVIAVPAGKGLRFTQLQTLSEYGKEKLTERGDAEHIRDAMATHFAALCAQSAAAYIGDGQRAWLAAIDQEHDNLRAALHWAVVNGDAETALTIAGGASWPHWLRGTIYEGKRWLDEAFSCDGEATETTRTLALTGRGLIEFLAGHPERSDDDLGTAIAIFERQGDAAGLALAHSFYAELAAVMGELDEARRRRSALRDLYERMPDDPFAAAARSYSLAKLAMLDGDLVEAEHHYRAATDGFGRLDRPVMSSICLGMVADFDERAGDFTAAIATLEAAIETNEALIGGFTGALVARLGWVLLQDGQWDRAETEYQRALESARRVRHPTVTPLALAGIAVLHRMRGRDEAARAAAMEGLEIHRAGGPRRFRNRIDLEADLQYAAAVCCDVLAGIAAEADDPVEATERLAEGEALRAEAGADVPAFQRADVDRTRALMLAIRP